MLLATAMLFMEPALVAPLQQESVDGTIYVGSEKQLFIDDLFAFRFTTGSGDAGRDH